MIGSLAQDDEYRVVAGDRAHYVLHAKVVHCDANGVGVACQCPNQSEITGKIERDEASSQIGGIVVLALTEFFFSWKSVVVAFAAFGS